MSLEKPKHVRPAKAPAAPKPKTRAPSRPRSLSAAAGELLVRALGPAADEVGVLLADKMAKFRAGNLDPILRQAEEELRRRDVDPEAVEPLPFPEAYRLFEGASLEESEDVQKLWAALLASAMDPASDVHAHKVLINILKQLEGPDAVLLEMLWLRSGRRMMPREELQRNLDTVEILRAERWAPLSVFAREVAVRNLIRLECAAVEADKTFPVSTSAFNIMSRTEPSSAVKDLVRGVEEKIERTFRLAVGSEDPQGLKGANEPQQSYLHADRALRLTALGKTLMSACRGMADGTVPK
ncbi:MAG: Abi-alpha family protein [Solirubrobacterales bacterium]